MNPFYTITTILICVLSFSSYSQVLIYEEHFDSLLPNISIGSQNTEFEPISGVINGADDPLVSDLYAQSPNHSLRIQNGDDAYYDFGGLSTGSYSIEFSVYLTDHGYFNLQHDKETGWACDIFLAINNEILYQDNPTTSSATVVGTYQQNTWMTFRFEIDIDSDVIEFYKDDTLLHTSVFSNATVGPNSNVLDVIDFYGLSGGFQGVYISNFFVDDFSFTTTSTSASIHDQEDSSEIHYFPNPVSDQLTITSSNLIQSIALYDLDGRKILAKNIHSTQTELDVSEISEGLYFLHIKSETGQIKIEKIFIK